MFGLWHLLKLLFSYIQFVSEPSMPKLKDLIAISKHIGRNLDLVQGAGGNTSLKKDGVLWVKASGCRLQDAEKRDIFVPVDYSRIIKELTTIDDDSFLPKIMQNDGSTALRPSIETSLHALMPHRYVVHVHSVNAIANAVLENGEKKLSQLLEGISWAWVPYVRPGVPLTRTVQKVMRSDLNVLVLANHGLVLGAESKEAVFELLNKLESRLNRPRREPATFEKDRLIELLENTDYKLSQYSLVHSLAFDPVALSIAGKNPLYPDHIVFLGTGPMSIMSDVELSKYLEEKGNRRDHEVIIIKNLGVITHLSLSESAEEMLHCLANVLLRIQSEEKLRYLTEIEQAEISGWDAEKFRQANQS